MDWNLANDIATIIYFTGFGLYIVIEGRKIFSRASASLKEQERT